LPPIAPSVVQIDSSIPAAQPKPSTTLPIRRPNSVVLPEDVLDNGALRNFLLPTVLEALKAGKAGVIEIIEKDQNELEEMQALLREVAGLDSAQQKQLDTAASSLEQQLNSLEPMTSLRREEIKEAAKKLRESMIPAREAHEAFKKLQEIHEDAWNVRLKLGQIVGDFQQAQRDAIIERRKEAQKQMQSSDISGEQLTLKKQIEQLDALERKMLVEQKKELDLKPEQNELIKLDQAMLELEVELRDFYNKNLSDRARINSKAQALSVVTSKIQNKFKISTESEKQLKHTP
jgi:hypothetical protein